MPDDLTPRIDAALSAVHHQAESIRSGFLAVVAAEIVGPASSAA